MCKKSPGTEQNPKKFLLFPSLEMLRAFYSPGTLYKVAALQMGVDLDTPRKILTSSF